MRILLAAMLLLTVLSNAIASNSSIPPTSTKPKAITGPTLSFSPNSGFVVSGASITIVASGGDPGGSSNYACAAPPGVSVTNNPGAIATNGATQTLSVSCPAGVPDGLMMCTRTGGNTTPVNLQVDCPAMGLSLASTPANGTSLSCNGAAGSTQHVVATIVNPGNAGLTGVSCGTFGGGFSIAIAPSAAIAPGATSNVVVGCTVPEAGTPVITGSLNCTTQSPAGGALAFPLSSVAQSSGVNSVHAVVPVSSIGTRLALVGLLAAFGGLLLVRRGTERV